MNQQSNRPPLSAQYWRLTGRVQGVGFRPFVYRLATGLGLSGWVRNEAGEVEILAQGETAQLERFGQALLQQAPPTARPELLERENVAAEPLGGFRILPSSQAESHHIHLPPDLFTCDDCLQELRDPIERRHGYPFINCTQCGPRYSIIRQLPYDRPHTSMAGFPLCPACEGEYRNPGDRRFHAQPLACPACGPGLEFYCGQQRITANEPALQACIWALRDGRVIAVKGIGGYHLMCDAQNEAAVVRLRQNKPRPHKPLALMFPWRGEDGLEAVRAHTLPTPEEAQLLISPERPIVLMLRRKDSPLPDSIAPGLDEIGAMLPYSPLHHLLLDGFNAPLVATSGNPSGEPVLTDNEEAEKRLAAVAEGFLHHNRPILRPVDDSLFRSIQGAPRPLRLGRGLAPLELKLPFSLPYPLLATGGQMKNTLALAWDDRVVISPHIGEITSPRSLEVFQQVAADLQALYGIQAQAIACDAHPGYSTSRWARQSGLPVTEVQHHQAHASALAGEQGIDSPWLIFTWDGVGYGLDGQLWGGETLYGHPGQWRRIATLRPFHPIGGDKAAREPWRSAAALCWEAGLAWLDAKSVGLTEDEHRLAHQAWRQRLNCPPTSAIGRLFDAVASLSGLLHRASFEGQGPMLLEAAAAVSGPAIELPLQQRGDGTWQSDWQPLLQALLQPGLDCGQKAAMLHASLSENILQQCLKFKAHYGGFRVGLSGGVFQNRLLTETAHLRLSQAGFEVKLNQHIPSNDAGLSFGQIIEAAASRAGPSPPGPNCYLTSSGSTTKMAS
jgi:hydrogenase maturation protein HypF